MRLSVERKPFADLLKQAASVAKGIGILANVKLSCQAQIAGAELEIEAASAGEACRLILPAQVSAGGEILVEAERLSGFVCLDTADSLTITHKAGRLTVAGRSEVRLSILPTEGFPTLPDPGAVTDWLDLPHECLAQAWERPSRFSSDKMLHGTTSSLLKASGGLLRAYGNGAAICYRAGSVSEAPEGLELSLLIPKEAARRLGGEQQSFRVGQAGGWLFVTGEQGWAFRQPEETHPDYERLPAWEVERQPEVALSPMQAKELLAGLKAMAAVCELAEVWAGKDQVGVTVKGDVQSGAWVLPEVDVYGELAWYGSLPLFIKGLSVVAEEGLGVELHGMAREQVRMRNALDEQVTIAGMKR